jgi:hypothetical protein
MLMQSCRHDQTLLRQSRSDYKSDWTNEYYQQNSADASRWLIFFGGGSRAARGGAAPPVVENLAQPGLRRQACVDHVPPDLVDR